MHSSLVIVLYSIVCLGSIQCFCVRELVPPSESCTYEGREFPIGGTLNLPAPACMRCTCHPGIMVCCGTGRNAGVYRIPDDCEEVLRADSCEPTFVQKSNPQIPCVF